MTFEFPTCCLCFLSVETIVTHHHTTCALALKPRALHSLLGCPKVREIDPVKTSHFLVRSAEPSGYAVHLQKAIHSSCF